jgi:hypothetical protein
MRLAVVDSMRAKRAWLVLLWLPPSACGPGSSGTLDCIDVHQGLALVFIGKSSDRRRPYHSVDHVFSFVFRGGLLQPRMSIFMT